jgi:hypothetical protein
MRFASYGGSRPTRCSCRSWTMQQRRRHRSSSCSLEARVRASTACGR